MGLSAVGVAAIHRAGNYGVNDSQLLHLDEFEFKLSRNARTSSGESLFRQFVPRAVECMTNVVRKWSAPSVAGIKFRLTSCGHPIPRCRCLDAASQSGHHLILH